MFASGLSPARGCLLNLPQAYRLGLPQKPPFARRQGPSSYAAVEQGDNRERWRPRGRQVGGNSGDGRARGAGGDSSGVSVALADSPSINVDDTADFCNDSAGTIGDEGGGIGAGTCAPEGGSDVEERGDEEQEKIGYEPPPAGAVATAAAAASTSSAVADLRPGVGTSEGGDGWTKEAADGVADIGGGEARWAEGRTAAGLEGAEGGQVLAPSLSSFKASGSTYR